MEVPWWVAALIAPTLLFVGNVIPPLIGNRTSAAEGLRDDMMKYAAQVKSDAESIRRQNEELFNALVVNTTQFSEFQGFVLRRSIAARIDLDQSDLEGVGAHLDELIGGAKKVNVTAPYWTKEIRDS